MGDQYAYRAGDIITVRTKVKFNAKSDEDRIFIAADGVADVKDITLVAPFFKVGETVRFRDGLGMDTECHGIIIGINDNDVWVKFDDGEKNTYPSSAFVLVQPPAGAE